MIIVKVYNKKNYIDIMENDWLYEFQKYIKKFALLISFIVIILLIILVIY